MNKLRYPEKETLCSYDLSEDFFKAINLKITDVTPLRKVFILQTEEGRKILKNIDYSIERLEFINECINAVRNKVPNVMKLRNFDNGKCYFLWKDKVYVIMDLIEGREVTFTNPLEVKMCGRLIASIHKESTNFIEDISKALNRDLKNLMEKSLVERFEDALLDIKNIKRMVSSYRYKKEFDKIFLENVDEHIVEMEKALELISFSGYSTFREDINRLSICHNDLAEHNFIIKDEKVNLIDFDYCTIDLRIVDLADFILKGIKNVAFDIEKAIEAIESYNEVYPLSKEEYKMLYISLLFPRDFYSLVRDYYHRQKSWEEEVFVNRFKNKLENEDFRRDFLENYREIFKDKFR